MKKQLDAISPKLERVEPGFRVPKFKTDEEEIAWLDRNYERLAELTLLSERAEAGAAARIGGRSMTRMSIEVWRGLF